MIEDFQKLVQIVYDLGQKINAPSNLLIVPNKPIDDGTPYIEIQNNKYYFVSNERGVEFSRKETSNVNELLYWIFEKITSKMSWDYEFQNRIENQDPRRIAFQKKLDLLEKLNLEWFEKQKIEINKIIKNNPFNDQ